MLESLYAESKEITLINNTYRAMQYVQVRLFCAILMT